ncbi:hypothetical protein L1987_24769 [Smallanthus sonchifolius]|uniref:Uncharacterized protein n=1 Tax=Smallanthus sonchifolius TaxID=185202 RepID=A0ACB9IKP9_9ASTR|nr:hypothetical protein L1987_24769 [Smallanthus sonchifolius]
MDSLYFLKIFLVCAVIFAFSVESTLGSIACENLNKDTCAFAVSSSGKRCVLEKNVRRSGEEVFVCSTSQIDTDQVTNWIESDRCLEACGLDRNVLGVSSDSLLDSRFMQKLCSTQCYNGCLNIVDLYFNLAVGEGVYLPSLCRSEGDNKRRGMSEIRSSGYVAPGPMVSAKLMADGSPAIVPEPMIRAKFMANGSPSMAPSPTPY